MIPECPVCGNTMVKVSTGYTGRWEHFHYECTACANTFRSNLAPLATNP